MSRRASLGRRLPGRVKALVARVRDRMFDIHARKSYAQEGEDLILQRIFSGRRRGFYVDVGAHHPRRFSNTHYLYRQGWSGINIKPNPDAMRVFHQARKHDINLQCGVADFSGQLTYYQFDDPALNTFDASVKQSRVDHTPYRLIGNITIPVEPLADILARCLQVGQQIDFLSIDVEGMDLQVLKSNDWCRYQPECALVESIGSSLEQAMDGEIFHFMKGQQFVLFAKTFNTLICRDQLQSGI